MLCQDILSVGPGAVRERNISTKPAAAAVKMLLKFFRLCARSGYHNSDGA